MDAMKLLLALCQGLMGLANLPEEAKALIQPVLDEAQKGSGGKVAPESAPVAKPPEPVPVAKPPEPPPAPKPDNGTDMGMRDDEALQKSPAFAKQMAAAVDAILEAREGLSDAAKSFAKTLGTPDKVNAYLKTIPLAKSQEAAKPAEQLGVARAPRGGNGSDKVAPSTDAKVNALFRIMPTDADNDGVTVHDSKTAGKLVEFSVVGAYAKIKKSTAEMVAAQKARMVGGAA